MWNGAKRDPRTALPRLPVVEEECLRSKHWIKVKNRKHPAMDRVMESFR
jgi:hypothetical protein